MSIKSVEQTITKTKIPSKYGVVLFNDEITSFDFVVILIEHIFNKSNAEATKLTNKINNEGEALIDIFPKNIALVKLNSCLSLAYENNYPLKGEIREVSND